MAVDWYWWNTILERPTALGSWAVVVGAGWLPTKTCIYQLGRIQYIYEEVWPGIPHTFFYNNQNRCPFYKIKVKDNMYGFQPESISGCFPWLIKRWQNIIMNWFMTFISERKKIVWNLTVCWVTSSGINWFLLCLKNNQYCAFEKWQFYCGAVSGKPNAHITLEIDDITCNWSWLALSVQ